MSIINSINNYFKRKSPLGIAGDFLIVVFIILLLLPVTRKETVAFFIRATLFVHQPHVAKESVMLSQDDYKWNLEDSENEEISFSEFSNKPVFLNFWGTWCSPCIAEMPDIQKLYEQFENQIDFVLVSSEEIEDINKFIATKKLTIPVYQLKTPIPEIFHSTSIPTTFIIDSSGKIVLMHKGVAKWNSKKIQRLLNKLSKN